MTIRYKDKKRAQVAAQRAAKPVDNTDDSKPAGRQRDARGRFIRAQD